MVSEDAAEDAMTGMAAEGGACEEDAERLMVGVASRAAKKDERGVELGSSESTVVRQPRVQHVDYVAGMDARPRRGRGEVEVGGAQWRREAQTECE